MFILKYLNPSHFSYALWCFVYATVYKQRFVLKKFLYKYTNPFKIFIYKTCWIKNVYKKNLIYIFGKTNFCLYLTTYYFSNKYSMLSWSYSSSFNLPSLYSRSHSSFNHWSNQISQPMNLISESRFQPNS